MPASLPQTALSGLISETTAGRGWVPLRDYCETAECTERTARNRARRGEIQTKKVAGHVFVRMERAK